MLNSQSGRGVVLAFSGAARLSEPEAVLSLARRALRGGDAR